MKEKTAARSLALQKRREAFADPSRSAAAQAQLRLALAPYQNRVLASYMAMRQEVDPLPVLQGYRGELCLPVVMGAGQALQFRSWSLDAPLVEGAFKALIPVFGEWVVPQVVIVPLLAYDTSGYRLGYGGGFYDRSLEALRASGPVLAIGFAFAAQKMLDLPRELTDQPLDMIVTEDGIQRF